MNPKLLYRLCLVLLLGLWPASVFAQDRIPDSYVLATYNIRTAEYGLSDLLETLKKIDADFLCLQEVHGPSFVGGFIDQAKHIAHVLEMEYFFSKNRLWMSGEYGVAILSKYPLDEKVQIPLPNKPGEEPEILLCGTSDTPKGKVHLCTAHLISKPKNKETNAPRLRLQQAQSIVDYLNQKTMPILFGGDLNAIAFSPVKRLFRSHFTDFMQVSGKGREATFPAGFPVVKLDYLFFRGPFQPLKTRVIKSKASDHRPLRAEFSWRPVP